jgi:tetratricopeptide (TPR) repeat protein
VSTALRSFTWLIAGALAGVGLPVMGRAFSNVALGERLENPRLPQLGGGSAELLSRTATVSLFVFFRPGQDRSLQVLTMLAGLQREFAGKPVRMVAVVSDSWPEEEAQAAVREAGFTAPVLIDAQDALYGALGVRLHPVVGLADKHQKLAAYEHFRQINFGEILRGRIRVMLGEATADEMARVLEPEKSTTGSPEAEARRYFNLARMLWTRKNAAKALEAVTRSLAIVPTAPAWALQGELTAAAGDCTAATPLFERALKIDPTEPVAIKGLKGCAR